VLHSIRAWINQCLRELNPDEDAREADVPELNRYLPDEEDEPLSEQSEAHSERGGEDGIVTAPLPQALIIQEVPPRQPVLRPASGSDSPSDGEEEGEGSGGGTVNPTDEETEIPGGEGDTTGGGATGPIIPHVVKTPLHTRSMQTGSASYDLIVRSARNCTGRLVIVSVGEDNREDKDLRILTVVDAETNIEQPLEQFSLAAGQAIRLRVEIDSTVPLSLRTYCHGN
jgi:hypothetical protein